MERNITQDSVGVAKFNKCLELRIMSTITNGKGDRYVLLFPKEARKLAIDLLTTAEEIENGSK